MATRKVEDGKKTLFPRIFRGPFGCHLPSSLVPESRFRGAGKEFFSEMQDAIQNDAELPSEYFPRVGLA